MSLPTEPAAPEPELELDIPPSPPPVEAALAARRARRLAIAAKYSNAVTPSTVTPSA
jgi:serine/threonine-protein kinase PRP4